MKKLFLPLILLLGGLIFYSCGAAAPVKELEDAKTSIERARSVEAETYAQQPFREAENSYEKATQFVNQKKNKEAKEEALTSKEKATLAYNLAITNRAVSMLSICSNLIVEIESFYGEKVDNETYTQCINDFETMKIAMGEKDVNAVYEKGKDLRPRLEELLKKSREAYEEVLNYIDRVREKYDNLSKDPIATEKSAELLEKAGDKIDEAAESLSSGEYENAKLAAKEAEEICKQIEDSISKEKQKVSEVKKEMKEEKKPSVDLEKQKQEALEAIKNAKEKEEKLKQRKKILMREIKPNKFYVENESKMYYLGDNVEIEEEAMGEAGSELTTEEIATEEEISSNIEEPSEEELMSNEEKSGEEEISVSEEGQEGQELTAEATETNTLTSTNEEALGESEEISISEEEMGKIRVKDEDISEEMVNKYISIAEEAYERGEYSKSILYANEAIRMADILLQREYTQYYRVRKGDCLWNIARFFYKNPFIWPIIYKANKDKIKHPDLIYPKQIFAIPPKPQNVDIKKLYKEINYKPLFR